MVDRNQSINLSTELQSTKSIITKQSTRIDLAEKCIQSHRVEITRLKNINNDLKNNVIKFFVVVIFSGINEFLVLA